MDATTTTTTTATARTRLGRKPSRGRHDRASIDAILDEGLVAHVAFTLDGAPYAMPTAYARAGDELILHGSPLGRMFRNLREGIEVCVTVTLLDGLVFARSAFHHSMNYRSAVVLGRARPVAGEAAKRAALEALVEHIAPGRAAGTRGPSANELHATDVLALPIEEASAKVRSGPPEDAPEDRALPYWAGELPLALTAGAPVPASEDIPVPAALSAAWPRGCRPASPT